MKTPYEILGVAIDANDIEIKQAYLLKVKDNPPDRDQEQFQLIHHAYTTIKDNKSRISYDLFTLPTANFEQLIDQALESDQSVRLNATYFNILLNASIDETTIQNTISPLEEQ